MKYENILVFDSKHLNIFSHHVMMSRMEDYLQYNFMAHASSDFVIGEYKFKKLEQQLNLFYADIIVYEQSAESILLTGKRKMLKDIIEMLTPAVAGRLQLGNSFEFEILGVSLCHGPNANSRIKSLKKQLEERNDLLHS